MEAVEIFIGDHGHIVIKQPFCGEDDMCVLLAPDQIDSVCDWLREARDEAQGLNSPGRWSKISAKGDGCDVRPI